MSGRGPASVERAVGELTNTQNGARIAWLTRRKIAKRFLLAPFRRRDVLEDVVPRRAQND